MGVGLSACRILHTPWSDYPPFTAERFSIRSLRRNRGDTAAYGLRPRGFHSPLDWRWETVQIPKHMNNLPLDLDELCGYVKWDHSRMSWL